MQHLGIRGAAHKASPVGTFTALLLLVVAQTASAQGTAPAADNAPSEAARRAAASPYRFIIQSSAAPRRPAAPAPAANATEPKKPTPAPVQQASVQPSATEASRPAPAPAASPVSAPTPEPAVAALTRKPPEPPMHLEIIPVRTDDPHLSPALLREEPHGTVKIQFDVQPDGSVGDVKVVSSTNRALNKPTVEAVQGWKFKPVDEVLTVQTEVVYNLDK